jgi:hypothetical protein
VNTITNVPDLPEIWEAMPDYQRQDMAIRLLAIPYLRAVGSEFGGAGKTAKTPGSIAGSADDAAANAGSVASIGDDAIGAVNDNGLTRPPAGQLPVKPQHPDAGVYPQSPLSKPANPLIEPGEYVFVQDADGIVHVVPNSPHMHPRVLGGGQPAAAAGEIVVDANGVVTELNNISGTFQHSPGVLNAVKEALERAGIPVDPNAIRPFEW